MSATATPLCPAPAAAAPRRHFEVVGTAHPRRTEVEAFVGAVYRRHFDATVAQWAPTLVSLCVYGRLAAAAGYRIAHAPLYLEHYLDAPVERAIAAHAGRPVARASVVEVGHFASTQPGEGRRLLLFLARHLATTGCDWVVSTATRELRELLVRVGVTPFALAPADPARLPDRGASWGCYYAHAPVVVAGSLRRGLATLERRHG